MTINEVVTRVNGKIAVNKTDAEVSSAYASDLLSDVMGHCGDESALITIQNHLNTIAVCTLVGIEIIIIPISIFVAKKASRDGFIQRMYTYGLCFSNFGFMGNAVVSALFPEIYHQYINPDICSKLSHRYYHQDKSPFL